MRIRFSSAAALGVVLCVLCTASRVPHAQTPKRLALVGGMLLTGYEVPPIHHAAVLIEGDKIVQAGPASEVKVPADATVVDTSGRTMLPGLIEAHGHLIALGHGNYETWFPWITAHGGDAMLMRVMETAAKQLLMAGVTTTVDLGAPLQPILAIRDRINKGEVVGTRVFASGPWISRGATRRHAGRLRRSEHRHAAGGGAAGRQARERRRRSDQGARGPDVRRLQGDRRRGAQTRPSRARPRLCGTGRTARARGRCRRAAARRLGGHGAAVFAGTDSRHRQRRPPGRRHGGAPRVGVPGYRGIPRAAAGSGDEEAVPAGDLRRDPGLAEELAGAPLTSSAPIARCSIASAA